MYVHINFTKIGSLIELVLNPAYLGSRGIPEPLFMRVSSWGDIVIFPRDGVERSRKNISTGYSFSAGWEPVQ